ncbi:trehalase family glycosidase [Herpetosiphon sp. NSE202]|uniref:trehalase family glycosidase n=1 Tax=Herpetosiphon sp. NSE202 TaxID=3351349 RepID=UPI0036447F69
MRQPAITQYIDTYWDKLVRQQPEDQKTLIGLPHTFMVPTHDPTFQEMFYWDSFFIALGLGGTRYEAAIVGMVENMAYLYQRFGVIPNASRYYFLSRSQPPFFTQLIWLAYQTKVAAGDTDCATWLQTMMALAEQEHASVWLATAHPHQRQVHRGLSRYFDINYLDTLACCESGWDHSTRCNGQWMSHLPVDLNSILYLRECDFAQAAHLRGDQAAAEQWQARAAERAATMQEVFWDAASGFFYDYNYLNEEPDLENPSLAGFYALWAGWASEDQAAQVVEQWLPQFMRTGGLVTTLKTHSSYQWASPNGWAPLQWIVVEGLLRYGYQQEAREVMQAWCSLNETVFERTNTMWEKYNVVDPAGDVEGGKYGSLPGFGWSNAVYLDFKRRLDQTTLERWQLGG